MKSPTPLKRYLFFQFILVSIIPVVVIAILAWWFLMPTIRYRTHVKHQAVARAIAGQVSSYMEGGQRQLRDLADYLQTMEMTMDASATPLLDAQCGQGEFFETLFVADHQHFTIKTVGLSRPRRSLRADLIGLDISSRRFINKAKGLQKAFWSETFLSTVSSRLAVARTVSLTDGFIIGEITLDKLSEFVSHLPVEDEFITLIMDGQSRVVADSRKQRLGQKLNLKGIGGSTHTANFFELDGIKLFGTLLEMDEPHWKIFIGQRMDKAFKPLRDTYLLMSLGLVLALSLSFLLSRVQAGRTTRLTQAYIARAEAIAQGNYSIAWPQPKTLEDDRLSKSLQSMVGMISSREKHLIDSKEQLQAITANVPVVVFQFNTTRDRAYHIEFVSKKMFDIFGVKPDSDVFERFCECLAADDKKKFIASIRDALYRVETWNYEGRFIRPDGKTVWFSGHSIPRVDGELIVHYGVLRDITQRRQMEESLRITQFSFENAPIGIYRIGPDFNIIEANKAAARSLGYTKNKLATLSVFDINPQAKREDADVFWHSLKDPKDDNFETILCRKDGHQIPVQITSKFLTYGDQEYSICFSWDITERKKYMEQLRQLRNYLANIIDSMPSVLVGVDCDGRITQWNRRAEQVTGMLSSHVLAKPLDSVFTRLSDQIALIKTAIQERRVIRSPKVMRKEEQDTRFEDITIYPLKANGVEGAVVRVDDITDQVRLEEMMIQSEKMLSVGGMAAGMAHEINNPLAGILQNAFVLRNRLTNAELLSNRKAAERYGITMEAIGGFMMDRGILKMLDAIQQSGQRAAEIVTNMLSFARKSENVISSQHIGTLLDQVLDLLQTDYDMKKHYDFKNVRIVKEYDPNIPPVPCEGSKIQQVFMNILKNGAEAMAEAEKPAIFALRIKADGRWVRVEIDDNGPGMDETTRRRIFEPFFTTKPIGKGTGLGMSVSYFIITEDHGGEMSVHDADDGGTRFIIRLPMLGKKPASGK